MAFICTQGDFLRSNDDLVGQKPTDLGPECLDTVWTLRKHQGKPNAWKFSG